MAVTFTNNFKNILDKLESILKDEFGASIPVYRGNTVPRGTSQAIQLNPLSSSLLEHMSNSETREFSINMRFMFNEINVKEKVLDHILRQISRIEAVVHDNIIMTLSDANSTRVSDCRIASTELNSDENAGLYVVDLDYRCQHTITF